MQVIDEALALDELNQMATSLLGDMVKTVVDIERRVLAVDAELHSDWKHNYC